jgi:PP-loop superfamily ATP-utilizing enzyme
MSWIFGILKFNADADAAIYSKIHDKALYTFSSPKIYIALGGIKETCFFEPDEISHSGWAVLGIGIRVAHSGAEFLKKVDWKNLLSSKSEFPASELDGHYLALRWHDNEVRFFTDQFGLRTAYYTRSEIGYCFSTRLDWLAQLRDVSEINKTFLGGRWLLFNQLNYESGVVDIERLGPAANVIIKNDRVIKREFHYWLPDFQYTSDTSYAKALLESLVFLSFKSDRNVSLALSGGLDSRTLLAIIMGERNSNFFVHTIGDPHDPDVLISDRIASHYNLRRQYFNEPYPDTDTLISLSETFAAENMLTEPCSSILKLRYYSIQHNKNQLVIDGANGEIARRQFLNRFVKRGKNAVRDMNIPELFKLLQVNRADIFNVDYKEELNEAAQNSLEQAVNTMPSDSEIGIENFADLFTVRTRFPNYGGPEQTRSDALIINYMPMSQPSFAKAVFKIDIIQRNNGKFHRGIIGEKVPTLKKFPLVKSGLTYPFYLKSTGAWVYTKFKSKAWRRYLDPAPDKFLTQLQEYILDLAHSAEVKNESSYNSKQIISSVDAYYKGEMYLRDYVNWWLTFELWKRSIVKKVGKH